MLEYVADSGSEAIKAFGEILSPEEYVSEVNRMKGEYICIIMDIIAMHLVLQ